MLLIKHFTSLLFLVQNLHYIRCQTFIRDCNALPGVPGTAYCTAACGSAIATPTCTPPEPDGLCLCNYPCGTPTPSPLLNPDICPPPANPEDYPDVPQQCMDACPTLCPGGIGDICGTEAPVAEDTYLTICTCFCPPPPCPNTTTTTPAPTKGVALFPNLVTPIKAIKKKVKWKMVAATLFKFGILFVKFIGLTVLKVCVAAMFLSFDESVNNVGWGWIV